MPDDYSHLTANGPYMHNQPPGAPTTPALERRQGPRWEYTKLVAKTDGDPSDWTVLKSKAPLWTAVGELGHDGWELVEAIPVMAKVFAGSQPGANRLVFIFKRPIEGPDAAPGPMQAF